MGTRGYFARNHLESSTAATICGPGISETARASAGALLHDLVDGALGIRIRVAIDDLVLFLAFEHRRQARARKAGNAGSWAGCCADGAE